MQFRKVTFENRNRIDGILKLYGGNSCQYSVAQMIGLNAKYGDEFCEVDDAVVIHRRGLDNAEKRVYLAPVGPMKDIKKYIDMIVCDACEYSKKVSFEPITVEFAKILEEEYPNQFTISQERDLAEYIYSARKMYELSGRSLASKRNRIHSFQAAYDPEEVFVEVIGEDNIEDVRVFQNEWLAERNSYENDVRLDIENQAIMTYLDHYDELGFEGIVIYVNGDVVGYAAGVPLSDECIDEVIEKGRRDIIGIYQVVCMEFAKMAHAKYRYINREEDLGIAGLRRAKESYHPDYLIEKCIAISKEKR